MITTVPATTLPEFAYVSDLLQCSVRVHEDRWLDEHQMSKLMTKNKVFHICSGRGCDDRRYFVYATFGHPCIRSFCTSMLPDYSMSADEVFIAALSWVDSSIVNEQLSNRDGLKAGAHDDNFQRYATFYPQLAFSCPLRLSSQAR